jgi:heme-degrading monooxygenase HmoA
MHVRMARYRTSEDPHELIERVENEMLPLYEGMPGFRAYSVAASGEEIFSFTVWDSAAEAEAANEAAAGWVAENLAEHTTLIETKIGELLLSTTLGVSAKVRA